MEGWINDANKFSHKLLKQSFYIVDVKGELAELKLYCDKGFAGFRFQPDLRYSVEDGFQDCSLTVIGNPGTTFTLVEIWPTSPFSSPAIYRANIHRLPPMAYCR